MSPLAAAVSPTLLAPALAEGGVHPPAAGFAALVQAGPAIAGAAAPAGSGEALLACSAVAAGIPAPETGSAAEAILNRPSPVPAGPDRGVGSPAACFPGSARGCGGQLNPSPDLAALAAPLLDLAVEAGKPLATEARTRFEVEALPESSAAPLAELAETVALEHPSEPPLLEAAPLPGSPELLLAPAPAAPSIAPAAPPTSNPVSVAPATLTEKEAPLLSAAEAAPLVTSGTSTSPIADTSAPTLAPGPAALPVTVGEPVQLDGALLPQQPPATAQPVAVQGVADPRPAAPMPLGPGFGERLGLTLARRVAEGRDEITVRMEPAELGRVQVKLSFDEAGSLRALVSADSPLVLDSLRREAGDLARALADNGVRTDAQSFRFDRGGGGQGGEQQGRPAPAWTRWQGRDDLAADPEASTLAQPLRHRGRLNLMA